MDIRKIYEYALQREYEGKRFFSENASRLKHPVAARAFTALADEEQKHIEFIQSQIEAIDKGLSPSDAMGKELEKVGFFSQRAETEALDQTVIEAMVPDLPILRTAYLIEADFAAFYRLAATKSEGEVKDVLNRLARWEESHERLFKQMHDKAFEEYAQMPWGG